MEKMRHVSFHSLEGDRGWQMRDLYSEVTKELDKYQAEVISRWQTDIVAELSNKVG